MCRSTVDTSNNASNTACPDLCSDAAGRIWTGTTGSSSVHHWVSLGVPYLLARPDGRPDTKRPHVVEHLRQQLPVRPSNSAGEAQRLWRQRLAADWHAVCGPSKSTTPLSSLHCSSKQQPEALQAARRQGPRPAGSRLSHWNPPAVAAPPARQSFVQDCTFRDALAAPECNSF